MPDQDRPQRPDRIRHACPRGAVALAQTQRVDGASEGAQRWRLNAGSLMTAVLTGINRGQDGYERPVHLVIDLDSVTFEAAIIPALRDHWMGPIGRWESLESSSQSGGIHGDLILYTSQDEKEAQMWMMREADEVAAIQRRGHPWQASVGIYPGSDGTLEMQDPGSQIAINGGTIAVPDDGMPTYVLRGGVVTEASVVLFGADSQTGQLAASRIFGTATTQLQSTEQPVMTVLLSLAAALTAAGKSAADIAAETTLTAAEVQALIDGGNATDEQASAIAGALGVEAATLAEEPPASDDNDEDDDEEDDEEDDQSGDSQLARLRAMHDRYGDNADNLQIAIKLAAKGKDDITIERAVHRAELERVNAQLAHLQSGQGAGVGGMPAASVPPAGKGSAAGQKPKTVDDAIALHAAELKGKTYLQRRAWCFRRYPDLVPPHLR